MFKINMRHTSHNLLRLLFIFLLFCYGAAVSVVLAGPHLPEGEKSIYLLDGEQKETKIGTVTFTPKEDGMHFQIKMDEKPFSEHFLSMRPFKCIEAPKQTVCHLVYPYKLRGFITLSDMADLEYSLLFLHKQAGEYGINFWNGSYYKLALTPKGTLKGDVYATDMNELASPPSKDYERLIPESALTKGTPDNYQYPNLEIK